MAVGLLLAVVLSACGGSDSTENSAVDRRAGAVYDTQICINTTEEGWSVKFENNVAENGDGPFPVPQSNPGVCGRGGDYKIIKAYAYDSQGVQALYIGAGTAGYGNPQITVKHLTIDKADTVKLDLNTGFTSRPSGSPHRVEIFRGDVGGIRGFGVSIRPNG
jgi:hypothetical protein